MLTTVLWVVSVSVTGALAQSAFAASDAAGAKVVFRKRCTGCHTYGKGTKVGPDLKGVTERRGRPWLLSFIRSSSKMIQSGDATAVKLFSQFKRERMPDWSDLSPQQVEAILDYFAADGPAQKEPDERHASTATAAEIDSGRKLFQGKARFAAGGRVCVTCHSIRGSDGLPGGSLGPDLTSAYFKYQDKALTDFLKRPSFVHAPAASGTEFLTPQESFDLKAYLARAAGLAIPAPATNAVPAKDRAVQTVASQDTKRGFR
jgi:mono/diheme cytochrome c family protein